MKKKTILLIGAGQPLPHELIFEVKYQSDLTHLVAKDIFSSGNVKYLCRLFSTI